MCFLPICKQLGKSASNGNIHLLVNKLNFGGIYPKNARNCVMQLMCKSRNNSNFTSRIIIEVCANNVRRMECTHWIQILPPHIIGFLITPRF